MNELSPLLQLKKQAMDLVCPPKGILAADESVKTATEHFVENNIVSTASSRRAYRQMLVTTPNFAQYVSGVIFYDETIRQKLDNGMYFATYLQRQGIVPGIKVDAGVVAMDNFPDQTITTGLDGLSLRLAEYYKLGARFTKWRAAFVIDTRTRKPSSAVLHANLHAMARYAAIAQSAGLVPIVEPEVLYAGSHTIETCRDVVDQTLRILFDLLVAYKVYLPGVILKTSMVLAGESAKKASEPEIVARNTLAVLKTRVPSQLGGIVFLSGGQEPSQATHNLASICKAARRYNVPMTFSFARALQEPAMAKWAGKKQNVSAAQALFTQRLALNSAATLGQLKT